MAQKACSVCGVAIPAARGAGAKTCSVACAAERNRRGARKRESAKRMESAVGRQCVLCGEPIAVQARLGTKYCSRICSARAYLVSQGHDGDFSIHPRPCQTCGDVFTPRGQAHRAAYCSRPCGRKAHAKKESKRRKAFLGTDKPRTCPVCASAFVPSRVTSVCCSLKCYSLNMKAAKFGLRWSEVAAMREQQGGRCAICGVPESNSKLALAIDHDHACCPSRGASCGRCVRGLLCHVCNLSLGYYESNGHIPASFADYLARYNGLLFACG